MATNDKGPWKHKQEAAREAVQRVLEDLNSQDFRSGEGVRQLLYRWKQRSEDRLMEHLAPTELAQFRAESEYGPGRANSEAVGRNCRDYLSGLIEAIRQTPLLVLKSDEESRHSPVAPPAPLIKLEMENQINKLMEEARGLKDVPYNSPRVDLWERRAKEFVRRIYGKDRAEIFDSAVFWGQMAADDDEAQGLHNRAMGHAIELLESLKGEPPQSEEPSPLHPTRTAQAPAARPGDTYMISGSQVFIAGRDIVNTITVKQIVEALQKEVEEKAPEGERKRTILTALKELATSKEFGEVTGTVIGEIVKRLLSQ